MTLEQGPTGPVGPMAADCTTFAFPGTALDLALGLLRKLVSELKEENEFLDAEVTRLTAENEELRARIGKG